MVMILFIIILADSASACLCFLSGAPENLFWSRGHLHWDWIRGLCTKSPRNPPLTDFHRIKNCFQAGLEHKTRKDLEAFLKAFIVPKVNWKHCFSINLATAVRTDDGAKWDFFGLFSLHAPRDGRKLFCDCRIAIVCHVTQPPCCEDLIPSLSYVLGAEEIVAVKKSWSFVKLVTSYWSTVQRPVYQSSTQQSFNLFWHQPTFPLMRAVYYSHY